MFSEFDAIAIFEGVDVALDKARPGITCKEVETAWQAVLNKNGYSKESRVGYSIERVFSKLDTFHRFAGLSFCVPARRIPK